MGAFMVLRPARGHPITRFRYDQEPALLFVLLLMLQRLGLEGWDTRLHTMLRLREARGYSNPEASPRMGSRCRRIFRRLDALLCTSMVPSGGWSILVMFPYLFNRVPFLRITSITSFRVPRPCPSASGCFQQFPYFLPLHTLSSCHLSVVINLCLPCDIRHECTYPIRQPGVQVQTRVYEEMAIV